VGFEVTTPEAPKKMKGLAESYLLIKYQNIEVERFNIENNGNRDVSFLKHSTKLKYLYLHALIDHVRSFFLRLFFVVLIQ
jgi:hypothetical protein